MVAAGAVVYQTKVYLVISSVENWVETEILAKKSWGLGWTWFEDARLSK